MIVKDFDKFCEDNQIDPECLLTIEEALKLNDYLKVLEESKWSVFESETYMRKRDDVKKHLAQKGEATNNKIGREMINWLEDLRDNFKTLDILVKRRQKLKDDILENGEGEYSNTVYQNEKTKIKNTKLTSSKYKDNLEQAYINEVNQHNTEDDLPF